MRGGNRINVIDGREKNEGYIQRKYLMPAAIDVIKKDAAAYSGTWPEKYKQFLQNENNHNAKRAWNYLISLVEFETKVRSESFLTALKKHVIGETAYFSAWKAAVHHDREKGAYSTIYQNTFKNDLINKRKENKNRGYLEIGNYDDFLESTKHIKNLFDHSAIMPWLPNRKIRGGSKFSVVFTVEDMNALKQRELDYLAIQAQLAKHGIYCTDAVIAQAMGYHASTIGRDRKNIKRKLEDKFLKECDRHRWLFQDEDDDVGFYGAAKGRGSRNKFLYSQISDGDGWSFEGYAKTGDGEIVNAGWQTEKPSYSRSDDDDASLKPLKQDRITTKRMNLPEPK